MHALGAIIFLYLCGRGYKIMSRPKQYDREVVLQKATELFWEKGFEATSVSELATKMNININRVYNEFESKDNLFALLYS